MILSAVCVGTLAAAAVSTRLYRRFRIRNLVQQRLDEIQFNAIVLPGGV